MDLFISEFGGMVAVIVISALACWLILRTWSSVQRQKEEFMKIGMLTSENAALSARNEAFESQLYDVQSDLDESRSMYQILNQHYVELKTRLSERELQHGKQLTLFEEQKKSLEKEFQNLANRIFDEKGKVFTETSQNSIEGFLKPFREQITEFRARVDGIHKENNESTGSLRKELEQLRALNQSMTVDAQNLTNVLKGDKKKIGDWGEMQLEKTLQLTGLIKGEHYRSQAHYKDATGKSNFPDFVVDLPDNKHIVIDSKVSLVAYDAAVTAKTDAEQSHALNEHIQALRNHIKGLAEKDYGQLSGIHSPSFVLMFLPIEPAYIEAMRFCPGLYDEAFRKGVILVSHSTLVPILKTVSNLWMIERSHSEVKEMSERAGEIYNQVCTLAERLHKLGGTMVTANKQYNNAVVALVGQQGLHGKVERFSTLSIDATKGMPNLEPIYTDIEIERLAIVVDSSLAGEDVEN